MTASRRDWGQLRKQVFDNTGTYLARKEERIQSSRKQETSTDDLSPLPPCKKTKAAGVS